MKNGMNRRWVFWAGLPALAAFLVLWLAWNPFNKASDQGLVVFCGIDFKKPLEAIAKEYQKTYGVPVEIKSGASQALLANLAVSPRGDLFLPKDESFLHQARKKRLVLEIIPLGELRAVMAVKKGNPKGIESLDGLLRADVKAAQADPDRTELGRVTREALKQAGKWESLRARNFLLNPNVNGVANDLVVGAIDAGFIWDSMLPNYPELESVPLTPLAQAHGSLAVGVLRKCQQPAEALRFARYLGANDKGLQEFARQNLLPIHGDQWAETPELVFYCGAMNRVAMEKTIKAFAEREGVRVTRIYNESTNLVAQMKTGRPPDAYLTGDQSFLAPVADLFQKPPSIISECDLVLLVRKGNPKQIRSLADLAKPGVRLGLAPPEQSTLGAFTRRLLEQENLLGAVTSNVVGQTPMADTLVSQTRSGTLDAALVFNSHALKFRDQLEFVKLTGSNTVAVQTLSASKNTKYKHLINRLVESLGSPEARTQYEAAGFRVRGAGGK